MSKKSTEQLIELLLTQEWGYDPDAKQWTMVVDEADSAPYSSEAFASFVVVWGPGLVFQVQQGSFQPTCHASGGKCSL